VKVPKVQKKNAIAFAIEQIGVVRIVTTMILGLVVSGFAFGLAVTGVARLNNPEVALGILGNESTALATRADQLFMEDAGNPQQSAELLAMASIREQPLNPTALRVLGYYADAKGETKKAEQLILASQSQSKREFGSQLWLIESSVRKNDIKQALVHYDLALRVRPDSQLLLFPTLTSAIEDASIREALKPYIRGNNGWAAAFLAYANANSQNLPALTELVIKSGGLPDKVASQSQKLGLISRLVSERYFGEARQVFLTLPNAFTSRLSDTSFDASDRDGRFGVMGWQIVNDPNAGSSFSGKASDDKTELAVFANSSTTGVVASKLLYLRPGPYRFSAQLSNLDRGDGGFLRWEFRCLSSPNAPPIWTLDSINMLKQATFEVQPSCPVHGLYLIASGGKGQTGLEATIKDVAVTKV
jgi:hypothetical protein